MDATRRLPIERRFCLIVTLVAAFGYPSAVSAQRFDAPQARVLYESESYSIQALVLYQSELILFTDDGGNIKPVLEVPRITEPVDEEGVRGSDERLRAQSRMNQGLEVAGTDQRIVGVAFDDELMYVLVAGVADIDPESLLSSIEEAEGDEVSGRDRTQDPVVRIMLHVYRHELARREFSFEVVLSQDVELEPTRFGEGPLEVTDVGVACYGWDFNFEEPDYVEAISPDGESLSLPSVLTRDRMRSI